MLKWARDTSGYSIEDVVEKLNLKTVSPETVGSWEQGNAKPSYAQLEKLAGMYKRSLAIFFFPSPPEEPALNEMFRSLSNTTTQSFPPQIRYLIRQALARQIDLYDLHGDGHSADIEIFRKKMKGRPQNDEKMLATTMREFLDIPLNEQFGWSTEDEALKQWRNRLEDIGVWVFKDAFQAEDYCGFCLYDENFPIIFLNNSMPKNRQIFTLFHEVAHLLIAKGGVDFRKGVEHEFQENYRQDEIFCNAFAGEFLVPDDNFPISTVPDKKQISDYAKKYKVSREVILRKCFERILVTQEFYNSKVMEWRESWASKEQTPEKKKKSEDYYSTQKMYLGDKYLSLVFGQYYQQRFDEYKLADYLGVKKVESAHVLEEYMFGSAGEWRRGWDSNPR